MNAPRERKALSFEVMSLMAGMGPMSSPGACQLLQLWAAGQPGRLLGNDADGALEISDQIQL